jgi:lipoate-protein ligase A
MHHGTLLFSSEISDIAGSLNVNKEKIESKGIKSVVSRVVNISSHLKNEMKVEEFISFLEEKIAKEYGAEKKEFSEDDAKNIQKLSRARVHFCT